MNSAEHRKWSIGQRLVMAFVCPTLLLLLNTACSAQTVTATPDAITDPAKPPLVTLTIRKADGTPDADTTGKVSKVKVGDTTLDVKPDAPQGRITFTPPANLSGPQQVQLLDAANNPVTDGSKPLGQTLTYRTPTPTPTPTPDPALYEAISRVNRQNELAKHQGYQSIVFLGFIGVLGAFVATIVKGILRSRSTFRNPLGLPLGSLRAMLAYTLVAFLGFYVMTSLLTVSLFAPPDFLLGIVATVVGFYFGSRTDEGGVADERAGIVRGIVRKDTSVSGAPVSGALVKFKRDDGSGSEPYSRLTDVDGRFVLQGAKPGKYKVSATATGSTSPTPLELNITEGSDQEVEIIIKGPAPPPSPGSVQGKVRKPDGGEAAGATVDLKIGNEVKGSAKTNDKGEYKIEVAAGKYDVAASLPGSAPTDKPLTAAGKVEVTAGAAQTLNLDLKPAA